jgi:hypothetical protein
MSCKHWKTCSECGANVAPGNPEDLCFRCKKIRDRGTVHLGPGRGHRPKDSGDSCACKVCGESFALKAYQDKRYTWYCPTCRADMVEITDGVLWLERLGIRVPPSKTILEAPLADALDIDSPKEVKNEETVRQADDDQAGPDGGAESLHAPGDTDLHPSAREESEEGPEFSNSYF